MPPITVDPTNLPVTDHIDLTDGLIIIRLGVAYTCSGETLRAATRPHLVFLNQSYAMTANDPGFKVDPLGQVVTITLPRISDAGGHEYAFCHVGDPDSTTPGTFRCVPQPGESIVHPGKGRLTEIGSTRPGESFGLRAEVVPLAGGSNRFLWLLARI